MASHTSEQTHSLSGKRIIVAGAGIAGLAFLRALHKTWPQDVTRPRISVYERDPRHLPAERGNYSLALRGDSASRGLQSLQQLDLIDEAYAARAPGSEGTTLVRDAQWNTLVAIKGKSTPPDQLPCSHMRITRHNIREVLIQGTENAAEMHWETACTSAATLKDGTVEVKLSDGSLATCDLLVIADGASSKLRGSLRPDDTLQFAGAVMVGGQAIFQEGGVPKELQEGGGPLLGGEGHGLVVFPTAPNEYVWFVTRRSQSPREAIKGDGSAKLQSEILEEARREGAAFGAPLEALLEATDADSLKTLNAQDKPPIAHDHILEKPIIFIGDSNHAVR